MTHRPLILITGATDGIGRETALQLARRGADVVVHGRDPARVAAVVAAVAQVAGRPAPEPVLADLASFADIRRAAASFLARGITLDVLLHNAGVFAKARQLTPDGHELTFAVNHLAPFLLTSLLLPSLQQARAGRVVVVSSIAHTRGVVDFDDLDAARGFDGYTAYASSKLMNVLFANELAQRMAASTATRRIFANSLHPGVVATKLLKTGFGMSRGQDDHAEGAATSVHLALSPDVEGISGRYFVRCAEATPAPRARDVEDARRLWEVSARLTGVEAT